MSYVKIKAVFEIFVLVCAIFTVYLMAVPQVVDAANSACCEKLDGSEDYCIFVDDENKCDDDGLKQVGTQCEATTFCSTGTCYYGGTGECSSETSKAKCESEEGSFDERPIEEVPICQQGCCVRPDGCDLVTKNECKVALQDYSNIPLDEAFRADIVDEFECSNICESAEVGCWVPEDPASNNCVFGYRSEFLDQGGEFRSGLYCSNVQECEVTKQYAKGCLDPQQQQYFSDDDNVHWFDSAGNPEAVVGSIYTGYVNDVRYSSSCSEDSNNVNNLNCGLCNVIGGSVCGTEEVNSKEEYQCVSLSCGTGHGDVFKWVPDNSQETGWGYSENGNNAFEIQNYDSWCYYEGVVGQGRDLVGTRHQLFRCRDGEIIPQPGQFYREEVCIMDFDKDKRPSVKLVSNDAFACVEANSNDLSCGGECSGINNDYDKALCCNQQKCENNENLCYWDDDVNRCGPQVSLGTLERESDINKIGNFECVAVFEYKLLRTSGDHWDCIANCDCFGKANDFNDYCNSLGDYGVYYNLAGELGEGGYTFTKDVSKSGINPATPVDLDSVKYLKNPETFISGSKSLIYRMWFDIKEGEKDVLLDKIPGYKSSWSRKFGAKSTFVNNPLFYFGINSLVISIYALSVEFIGATYVSSTGLAVLTNALSQGLIGDLGVGLTRNVASNLIGNEATKAAIKAAVTEATKGLTEDAAIKAATEEATRKATEAAIEQGIAEQTGTPLLNILNFIQPYLFWIGVAFLAVKLFEIIIGNKEVHYKFTCDPWLPPSGDQQCELCNDDPSNSYAICDEYRCDSLGANCEFIAENPDGSTAEIGICRLSKDKDLSAPVISPLRVEDTRVIEPVGTEGYNIKGIFDRKSSIVLGVKTNELAACKIHKVRETDFDSMIWFDDETWQTEHTVELFFTGEDPGQDSLLIYGSGDKSYYVSCRDTSGNIKPNYKIQFNVKEGPDITKPVILKIDPINNAYIPYNQESTNAYIFVEEESGLEGCKYSVNPNTDYEEMEGSFTCSSSATRDSEGYTGYKCVTKLENLRNNQDNKFYFKCEDKEGNINSQDQPIGGYTLKGSNPLLLDSVGPEGIIYERDVILTANTKSGAEGNGNAECRYSLSTSEQSERSFETMFSFAETDSNSHSHELINLENGDYYIQVMCRDIGGNADRDQTTFTIDTPELEIISVEPIDGTTIYELPLSLKVITSGGYNNNGDSNCYYDGFNHPLSDKEVQGEQTIHTIDIYRDDGDYTFEIICIDDANKEATEELNVKISKQAVPELRRVYTEGNLLSIEVSEPSECRYYDKNFDYEDGTEMVSGNNGYKHQASLGSQKVFYIICENVNNGNRNGQPFIVYI
jgi:hypothetical protein